MDGLLSSGAGGGLLGGMSAEDANKLINSYYQSSLMRPAEQAGLDYWSNLLTSGQATPEQVRAAIAGSTEAQRAPNIQSVPFGSQVIGGSVRPVANYNQAPTGPSMPAMPQMQMPQASNPFMAALQYQSSLPWSMTGFNPADMPATYQQIAQPQRLDWNKVTVPQWLQDAINKGKTDSSPSSGSTSTPTGVRED